MTNNIHVNLYNILQKFVLIFILAPCFVYGQSTSKYLYKNLVFEGGGIRGIAYGGVIKELEGAGITPEIRRVAGTSVGSIIAVLLAVGYNGDEIINLVSATNFKKFADGCWGVFGGSKMFVKQYGWYRGKKFTKWLEDMIEKKTGNANLTFAELHLLTLKNKYMDLFVTGTNLSKQTSVIFSHETFPDMKIVNAVRISMSIPLFFSSVKIDNKGNFIDDKNADVMVDGGLASNFPIHIFDEKKYQIDSTASGSIDDSIFINYETLGIRLDRAEQILFDKKNEGLAPYEIENLIDYFGAFYTIVIENLNRHALVKEDWDRTISVNTLGIGPKIRNLSDKEKLNLINSGKKAVDEFLEK